MNESQATTLGDVAMVQSGFAFKSKDWREAGVPVVKIQNVRNGRVTLDGCSFVSGDVASGAARFRLARGDVLVTMSGEIGSVGFVRTDDHLMLNQRVGRLSLREGADADLRYLGYTLLDPKLKATMEAIAHGAAQPNISPKLLAGLPVWLPSHGVQSQIADVLDVFADLIENNRRRVAVLEEMTRAIYREWFVKFRYPGHEDIPLIDSPLGPIPDGWTVEPVSSAIDVNPRIKLDKSVDHPFIAMGDLDTRSMSCRPNEIRSGGSGAKFQQGDTLFARITPCLENGKTGLVQTLSDGVVGLGSTEFIVLRGRLVGPAYTYCLTRDNEFRGHAKASMSGASGRQRVRNECFNSYLVAVPPVVLAAKFEATASPLLSSVKELTDSSGKLAALRDLLLPKLVTGQIDVSGLDLDAPMEEQVAS